MNTLAALPAALAFCVILAGTAGTATARDLPSLLDTIMLWLVANFELDATRELPTLAQLSDAEMVAMRYGEDAEVRPGEIVALYDDAGRMILLSESWTGDTPAELSVLVHEMVHHLQSASGARFACPAEREVVAYRAQDAWLGLFGESLESAFGIDRATLLVGTLRGVRSVTSGRRANGSRSSSACQPDRRVGHRERFGRCSWVKHPHRSKPGDNPKATSQTKLRFTHLPSPLLTAHRPFMDDTLDTPLHPTGCPADATRYQLACEAARIGVWELHVAEDRLVYSHLARSIFGFPAEGEVTREMVHRTIHPDDLEIVLAAARRAMDPAIRSNETYAYRISRRDTGELRFIRAHGIARFAEGSDRAVLYAGSVRDVTEEELTRQALADSEERLRLAVDAAGMAVWDLDVASNTVAHSPGLNRILGFPEAAHPTVEDLQSRYAPGEQERLQAEGAAAQERGEAILQSRVRYEVPGKGEVTCVLRAATATSVSGEANPKRVIGVLYDVTEQARAEDRLKTLNDELRHRLKNVANLAGIFARQTWPADDARDSFLGRLRALSMSADLMFGSIEDALRMSTLLAPALEPFRSGGTDQFVLDGPDIALPGKVFGGLALLLHELATNAVKHGALSVETGQVSITWEKTDPGLVLRWQETGGPPVSPPSTRGFGLKLIAGGALPPPHEVEVDFSPSGLTVLVKAYFDS